MQHIKENLQEQIRGKKSVFLFTGDKGSTLLLNVAGDMNVNIVFIDTGYQFGEIMDYVKSAGGKIEILMNNEASSDYKLDMFKCCSQRKVKTLKEYLINVKAECLIVPFIDEEKGGAVEDSYLSGISNIKIIRPLADLTERDVWVWIKEKKLQYSSIYKKGYRIVDCSCCTTRNGRKKQDEDTENNKLDEEIKEKLESLGYL